jgi:hypothetical protein
VAAYSRGNPGGLYLVLAKNACNHVGNVIELHDLTVNYRVGLEILESEMHELKAVSPFLQFNGFYRARTDIEANKILFAHIFFEHDLFNPRDKKRANLVLSAEAGAGFHRS